jgi:uncharacterized protein (DUF1778 family)
MKPGRPKGATETPERLAVNLRLPEGGTALIEAAAARVKLPVAAWMRRVLLRAAKKGRPSK